MPTTRYQPLDETTRKKKFYPRPDKHDQVKTAVWIDNEDAWLNKGEYYRRPTKKRSREDGE
jgi:hypothetical protein